MLYESDPLYADGNMRVFASKQIQQVETEKLIYFAVSIFWRASVGRWVVDSTPLEPLEFGKQYTEQFRRFLLEESGFPVDVALITKIIPPHEPSLNTIIFPYGGRSTMSYHEY